MTSPQHQHSSRPQPPHLSLLQYCGVSWQQEGGARLHSGAAGLGCRGSVSQFASDLPHTNLSHGTESRRHPPWPFAGAQRRRMGSTALAPPPPAGCPGGAAQPAALCTRWGMVSHLLLGGLSAGCSCEHSRQHQTCGTTSQPDNKPSPSASQCIPPPSLTPAAGGHGGSWGRVRPRVHPLPPES